MGWVITQNNCSSNGSIPAPPEREGTAGEQVIVPCSCTGTGTATASSAGTATSSSTSSGSGTGTATNGGAGNGTCCDSMPSPAVQLSVHVPAVSNGSGCSDCAVYGGDFTIDYQGDCFWGATLDMPSLPCGLNSYQWSFSCQNGVWTAVNNIDATTWEHDGSWDGVSDLELTTTAPNGQCAWPTTITISVV